MAFPLSLAGALFGRISKFFFALTRLSLIFKGFGSVFLRQARSRLKFADSVRASPDRLLSPNLKLGHKKIPFPAPDLSRSGKRHGKQCG